jgi:hypothetical protein
MCPACQRLTTGLRGNRVRQIPSDKSHYLSFLFAGKLSSSATEAYDLTLGVAQRLDTGGLVKARVKQTGQLSLLYQQAVSGVGQVALTCSLDPLKLNKEAPAVGVSITL